MGNSISDIDNTSENNNDVENARYWYNQGVESEKYMVTVTSNEDYQKLKEQCKSSLERLKWYDDFIN